MSIDYERLEDEFGGAPKREKIRKSTEPVNTNHDFQRKTEDKKNRFRKQRQLKEKNREPSTDE